LVPSTDTTQALSQILRDLIQTLPRHSNPNRIDISSPGDNLVAGTITPPSEGRPTNPDPKSQQVELPPDEFPAHPVDRSEIAAPVPMDAGANVQNVSDSLGVPIPPRVPLVGSSFEPGSVSLASTDRIDVTASPAGSPPGIVPSSAMGREVVHSIIPAPVDSTAFIGGTRHQLTTAYPSAPSEGMNSDWPPATIASESWRLPSAPAPTVDHNPAVQAMGGLGLRLGDGTGSPFSPRSPEATSEPFWDQSTPRTSGFDEAGVGADSGRTNTLLEQILDELRKSRPPSLIASGRSVYPER
jgi:hypothetical protein